MSAENVIPRRRKERVCLNRRKSLVQEKKGEILFRASNGQGTLESHGRPPHKAHNAGTDMFLFWYIYPATYTQSFASARTQSDYITQ